MAARSELVVRVSPTCALISQSGPLHCSGLIDSTGWHIDFEGVKASEFISLASYAAHGLGC